MSGRKTRGLFVINRLKAPELSGVLACAASMLLTGVPPAVCESMITEVYISVRKSISSIIH